MIFEKNLATLIESILNKGVEEQKSGGKSHFKDDEKLFENLVDYLRCNEDIASIFDEKMMNTGNGYASITLNSLAKWLVYNTVNSGTNETLKLLNDFLKLDYTPVIAILAVSGIEPSEKIQLSDTIELIPFVDLPPSKAKNALYPSFLKENPGVDILNPAFSAYNPPKMALVKKVQLKPKVYDSDNKKANTLKIAYSDLYKACEFLTLHSNSTPVPAGNWAELDEGVPCRNMLEVGFSYPSLEIIVRMDIPFHKYEWDKIQPIFHQFAKLDERTKNLLSLVLNRLNQSRRRQKIEDKVIDLGIAFEVLFLNDKEHKNGISWQLKHRVAYLVEKDIEMKKKIIDLMKTFYDCRSKATHVGQIDREVKVSNREKIGIQNLLNEADELCVKSIKQTIVNGGFPNWDKIVLKMIEE